MSLLTKYTFSILIKPRTLSAWLLTRLTFVLLYALNFRVDNYMKEELKTGYPHKDKMWLKYYDK